MTAATSVPVHLVRGSDEALVADAARSLLQQLREDGYDVEEVAAELSGAAVAEACNAFSLFGGRRAVVVRDAGRWRAEDADHVLTYLADPNPDTTLVLVSGGGTLPAKLADAAKKQGRVIDTTVPTGKGRTAWLSQRLAGAPVRFDRAAAERLAEHLGEDLGRLPGIVDVLVAIHGEGARIGAADLEPVLGTAGTTAPWDLTDAIDRGDAPAALDHLHRLVDGGRHPLVVMAGLHRHYSQLLRLDGSDIRGEDEAAKALGLKGSRYPARKALVTASRLGSARIGRAITLLADADLDLRGVRDWPEALVLEVLVARLARLAPTGRRR